MDSTTPNTLPGKIIAAPKFLVPMAQRVNALLDAGRGVLNPDAGQPFLLTNTGGQFSLSLAPGWGIGSILYNGENINIIYSIAQGILPDPTIQPPSGTLVPYIASPTTIKITPGLISLQGITNNASIGGGNVVSPDPTIVITITESGYIVLQVNRAGSDVLNLSTPAIFFVKTADIGSYTDTTTVGYYPLAFVVFASGVIDEVDSVVYRNPISQALLKPIPCDGSTFYCWQWMDGASPGSFAIPFPTII